MKLTAVLVAALVACDAVSGASAATAKAAAFHKAVKARAARTAVLAAKGAHVATKGGAHKANKTDVGPFTKGVMTFDTLGLYEQVEDTYESTLGVYWNRAAAVSQEHLYDMYLESSNMPSLPNCLQMGDIFADSAYGSMTVESGLVGGISFYYASNAFLVADVAKYNLTFQYARVAAFSDVDGQGKRLGEMILPWTTGDYTYTFKKVIFPWKGVAKSVSWYPAIIDGDSVAYSVLFDNVKVAVPSGELATKLVHKAMEAEAILAEKADELDALKIKISDSVPELKKEDED